MTPALFKRSIRDLQVWCSSCMVAFAGSDPIGVLIGAKRPSGTLVHKIAVHLLTSLSSKLAILGPPRIIAEVPETLAPACALFGASGYVQETLLTDYVFSSPGDFGPHDACDVGGMSDDLAGRFVIPVTVDDLAANGLLAEADPPVCWTRSVETLVARKNEIAGIAVASADQIEAYVLYAKSDVDPAALAPEARRRASPEPWRRQEGSSDAGELANPAEVVALRTFIEDGGTRLWQLLFPLARSMGTLEFPKVHPAEMSKECLETLGFRAVAVHRRYVARARSD
jgi:hypothetical protein